MAEIKPKTVKPATVKTGSRVNITPIQLNRIAQDAQTRKDAIAEAERAYFPYRYKMQQMFLNTLDNGHIQACLERRKDLTLLRKFEIKNEAGDIDLATTEIFCNVKKVKNRKGETNSQIVPKTWFTNFMSHAWDAIPFGYSLIYLNDVINNGFPKLEVVKRWNVSPDRLEVTNFPYMIYGVKFLEDPAFKDWYVYIDTPNALGTSPCGYGLLYDISICEIFLRNLLGFNGSFVELFSQPFRWGTTTKTLEDERAEFAAMLQNIGSSGWGMADPGDEIEFKESSLGGTGYKGYDNLEARLQKIVSKVILGHADALDSTPGKLGSGSGEDSPTYQALRDKQTKDGVTMESIINDILIPKMRDLGFNIPLGTTISFKNDAEAMDNAATVTALAKDMKSGGLQMDAGYFTEQTGIPVTVQAPVIPLGVDKKIAARLNGLYGVK